MKALALEEQHAAAWHHRWDTAFVPFVRSVPARIGLQVRVRDVSGGTDFLGEVAQSQHCVQHDGDARAVVM